MKTKTTDNAWYVRGMVYCRGEFPIKVKVTADMLLRALDAIKNGELEDPPKEIEKMYSTQWFMSLEDLAGDPALLASVIKKVKAGKPFFINAEESSTGFGPSEKEALAQFGLAKMEAYY